MRRIFARHQRNSQSSALVVVISGDGELLTSATAVLQVKCCPCVLSFRGVTVDQGQKIVGTILGTKVVTIYISLAVKQLFH